jgi:hypothetical protein
LFLGLWFVGLWANFRGTLPTWALIVLAPSLILTLVLVLLRLRLPDSADALSPWRDCRIMRGRVLRAEGLHSTTLTVDLAREPDLAVTAATLRFHGVMGLVVKQFGGDALCFDGLRCDDRGTTRRDERRFRVYDRCREMIEFTCRSFEEVRPETASAAG